MATKTEKKTTVSAKRIEERCYKAYEKGGMDAVFDLVNEKFADDKRITWEHCTGCDNEVPTLNGSCLACGITIEKEV
jgi:hypothetical protein